MSRRSNFFLCKRPSSGSAFCWIHCSFPHWVVLAPGTLVEDLLTFGTSSVIPVNVWVKLNTELPCGLAFFWKKPDTKDHILYGFFYRQCLKVVVVHSIVTVLKWHQTVTVSFCKDTNPILESLSSCVHQNLSTPQRLQLWYHTVGLGRGDELGGTHKHLAHNA